MPLAIISFFGDSRTAPVSDADLKRAWKLAQSVVPEGSKVEARALDRTFLHMRYPKPDGAPEVKLNDPASLPPPIAAGAITVWMDDALDNVELKTQQTAKALHEALSARTTGTFDARRHLDRVGNGTTPTLQALAVVERRPDLDRDTFMQYYRTHHVPLAKSLKPRFVRYTTFRLLERIGDFPGDCVTLQEYPSLDELLTHLTTRTAKNDTAGDDIGNFIAQLVYNIGERTLVQSETLTDKRG